MRVRSRVLSQADFAAMGPEWDACLARSDADPLFMSWAWLFTWWETWSVAMRLELVLIGVFDEGETLVGIGPFFRHRYRTPIGLRIDRLHALGNAWRIGPSVRTEYTSLIVDQKHATAVTREIFSQLSSLQWDELIVSDVVPDEVTAWLRHSKSILGQLLMLVRNEDKGVCVDTRGRMEDWLKKLGPNTRLKLYNRRRYLEGQGQLEVSCISSEHEVTDFFERLNRFHLARWGKPCFDPLAVRFHLRLRGRLRSRQTPQYSVMRFDQKIVSLLYDIKVGDRVYNLQSGYEQHFDRKISLGTLHFGFAIEEAFAGAASHYDLLAGSGRNTFYKKHLKGQVVSFQTVQFVRKPALRLIYGQHGKLPRAIRPLVNRLFRL